jgi:transcriptional antiterminator NusG
MIYDRNVWFAIRNTPGVLGFVGSSGKGAVPIPITIEEYARVSGEGEVIVESAADEQSTSTNDEATVVAAEATPSVTYTTNAKVGHTVDIFEGSFAGMVGEVKKLDQASGIATVIIDFFGRSQEVEIPYSQFRLSL